MNDFDEIRKGERSFRPEDSVVLHEASRAWLVSQLEQAFDGPTVVVTHHLPASTSIAKRFANDSLNPAFASSLEGLISPSSSDGSSGTPQPESPRALAYRAWRVAGNAGVSSVHRI